jgi:predicted nucleic acid-binding protein
MRVMFDTNVILDLLLDREPFVNEAKPLIAKVEQGVINGVLCATTVTTIHYLLCKSVGRAGASEVIGSLLKLFEIASVTRAVLEDGLEANDRDYEDAVLYKSAYHAGIDLIVTRDRSGFGKADMPVMNPQELLVFIENRDG